MDTSETQFKQLPSLAIKNARRCFSQHPKANVDTDSGIVGTSLQAAACHGLSRIVKLLLSNEEDTKPVNVNNADDVFGLLMVLRRMIHKLSAGSVEYIRAR